LFFHHGYSPAHWSVFFKGFIADNDVTTLQHLSFFPGLATAVFLLVHSAKISIEVMAVL
jgi:hypothetical protein